MEKNSINILAPESIAGKHDSAIGNFGAPDYGGSMILDLQIPSKGTDSDGCKPFEPQTFKRTGSKSNPTVALLDRGGMCSFLPPFFISLCFDGNKVQMDERGAREIILNNLIP